MPKGPQGQQRPADVIGNAVHIARIATGETDDSGHRQPGKVRSGKAGAKARAENMTPEERRRAAQHAAKVRWANEE